MARVFRVSKNIVNVNGFAFQHDASDGRAASRPKSLGAHVFKILSRVTVMRGRIIAASHSGGAEDLCLIRLA